MVKTDNVATSDFLTQKKLARASKTNLPSLIDMVRQYKLGRTNQKSRLSRKAELAALLCEAMAATSRVTSTVPHRIRDGILKRTRDQPFAPSGGMQNSAWIKDGLLVIKGNLLRFLLLLFFRYAAERARSATHERSENKEKS